MSPSLAYVSAQLGYLHDYMTQSFNAVETTLRNHSDRLRRIESQRLPARTVRDDHASSSDHPPPSLSKGVQESLSDLFSSFFWLFYDCPQSQVKESDIIKDEEVDILIVGKKSLFIDLNIHVEELCFPRCQPCLCDTFEGVILCVRRLFKGSVGVRVRVR
ncbi:hypothetical protein Syun_023179 [Stephania yunnanensis]|uniref:Uncharacterized protein n=1 Tax=Stephania yunnanensis TaxID=152371 RepID=A0AAP0FLV0_9MAGN